jgi:hypothetical protein
MLPPGGGGKWKPPIVEQIAEETGLSMGDPNLIPTYQSMLEDSLFGSGSGTSGGASYRPQTPEEAAFLTAQTKDIPLRTELARRTALAEIGATQAGLAANPRRIFEALFYQARVKPTQLAKSLQKKVTIPGFKKGGKVKGGSVLSTVGEKGEEYALLPPGSVVAPKPKGEKATAGNALSAIIRQMSEGGTVSPEKARKILEDGEIDGVPLTEKQRRFFGLIAGGGEPTRIRSSQGGIDLLGVPQSVQDEYAVDRRGATKTVIGATRQATSGTSLFDPLGGSTLGKRQKAFLGGLNLRDYSKMSPTQQAAAASMLSANRAAPEDYEESLRRQFAGFNPVQTGTRARFGGILGR